jgi:hypothetical protein
MKSMCCRLVGSSRYSSQNTRKAEAICFALFGLGIWPVANKRRVMLDGGIGEISGQMRRRAWRDQGEFGQQLVERRLDGCRLAAVGKAIDDTVAVVVVGAVMRRWLASHR